MAKRVIRVRPAKTLQDYVRTEQKRSSVYLSATTEEYRRWLARRMAKS